MGQAESIPAGAGIPYCAVWGRGAARGGPGNQPGRGCMGGRPAGGEGGGQRAEVRGHDEPLWGGSDHKMAAHTPKNGNPPFQDGGPCPSTWRTAPPIWRHPLPRWRTAPPIRRHPLPRWRTAPPIWWHPLPRWRPPSSTMAAATPNMATPPPPKDGGSHQKRELPTPKMAPPTGLTRAAILPEVTHRAQVGSGRGQAGGGRWGGSAPRGAALPIGQRGRGVAAASGRGGRGFRRPRPPITF